MKNADSRDATHCRHAGVPCQSFPEFDDRADLWVTRQLGVNLRFVGVMQHIHHMGAADAWWIVESGILKTARLQVLDALGSVLFHFLFGAKHNSMRRTSSGASRPLA